MPLTIVRRAFEQVFNTFNGIKPDITATEALYAVQPLVNALMDAGVRRMALWQTVSGRLVGSCT
jgi:ketol-acid reductoisomerase